MIEQVYKLAAGDDKTIEKILHDENIHYNHIILGKNEGLPDHYSNSNVYMTVLRGTLSIAHGEEPAQAYGPLTLLKIPADIKMRVRNEEDPALELIVVKAPAPK